MLPLRAAARLLVDARSLDGLAALADALGHGGATTPVPVETLGLADAGLRLAVRRGAGLRRALLVEAEAGEPLRLRVARLARVLAVRTPHALWCVLAAERNGPATVIATWSGAHHPPRVLALTVDRRRIVDSDADAVRALHAARDEPDVLAHARWLDVLGRDALGRRFYHEVEGVVAALADSLRGGPALDDTERRELALLQLSRLLFLSFLEAKGWLDGDRAFLAHLVERRPAELHRRTLRPLFFGTLNTPHARRAAAARAFGRIPFLNGGLFSPTPLERRAAAATLGDDALAAVLDRLLARYRFTAREDEAAWSDAAVDPEMLGRAFESLMHAGARRATGAYYTPQPLVARVVEEGLGAALGVPGIAAEDAVRIVAGAVPPPELAAATLRRVESLRVLDPACGSGAMLVHALERMADLARRCGDPRPVSQVRRRLLARSIFGVDVNATAVWLCELRLWLAAVIDEEAADPMRVTPLPNLDRNVRVGDALLGGGLAGDATGAHANAGARSLVRLRERYARATGPAKHAAARTLDRRERDAALAVLDRRLLSLAARRRDLLAALRGRDLFDRRATVERGDRARLAELRAETRRVRARRRAIAAGAGLPFAFASHFADLAGSGFDAVIGNPPWVRPHHVAADARLALRRAFPLASTPWEEGARLAGAGHGFAAQADLAALFVERAASLLRPGGALALLVPSKLWRSLAGGGCRRLLTERCALAAVEDWSRAPAAFDAAVYPSLVVATRKAPRQDTEPGAVRVGVWQAGELRRWRMDPAALPLDASPGAPWLPLPPDARATFDRIRDAGPPLARTALGRPILGVKCGVNAAFVLPGDDPAHDVVEPRLLRPALRGDAVRAWRVRDVPDAILWTHDDDGAPLDALPPGAQRRLLPYRRELERRADHRDGRPWWSLHRTAAGACDAHRVVWADVARRPRAAVLTAGDPTVPLNSCYVLRCADLRDALAVAAILNAPTLAAWLGALAEPARGGYARHLAWTVACLPMPADWARARDALAPLAERAWCGAPVDERELDRVVLGAYGLADLDVAPLLAWAAP